MTVDVDMDFESSSQDWRYDPHQYRPQFRGRRLSWFELLMFDDERSNDCPALCPPGLPVFGVVEESRDE